MITGDRHCGHRESKHHVLISVEGFFFVYLCVGVFIKAAAKSPINYAFRYSVCGAN